MKHRLKSYIKAAFIVMIGLVYVIWRQPGITYPEFLFFVFLLPLMVCGVISYVNSAKRKEEYIQKLRYNIIFSLMLFILVTAYFNLFFTWAVADVLKGSALPGWLPWPFLLHDRTSNDTLLTLLFFAGFAIAGTYLGEKHPRAKEKIVQLAVEKIKEIAVRRKAKGRE